MDLALVPTDLLKQELLKRETLSHGLEIDLHDKHDSLPLVFQLKHDKDLVVSFRLHEIQLVKSELESLKLLVDTALSKLEA